MDKITIRRTDERGIYIDTGPLDEWTVERLKKLRTAIDDFIGVQLPTSEPPIGPGERRYHVLGYALNRNVIIWDTYEKIELAVDWPDFCSGKYDAPWQSPPKEPTPEPLSEPSESGICPFCKEPCIKSLTYASTNQVVYDCKNDNCGMDSWVWRDK